MNKHQLLALLAFIFLFSICALLTFLVIKFGWQLTLAGMLTTFIILYAFIFIKNKFRYSILIKKYNDEQLARKIMRRTLWKGQTAEQVIDAIGKPKDIEQKVLKIKNKEIWKYFSSERRRYGLRITLNDEIVVGWDKKV